MVRFDDEEWLKFLSMYDQSCVYARAVFIKARVFSQPFRVIKTDKTLLDYYTKLSSFHAQYRAVDNNCAVQDDAMASYLGRVLSK